jgi:hypothetical protein
MQKKTREQQAAWLIDFLKTKPFDGVTEQLLQLWLLKGKVPMLTSFLDAAGIKHDGKGQVAELPEEPLTPEVAELPDVPSRPLVAAVPFVPALPDEPAVPELALELLEPALPAVPLVPAEPLDPLGPEEALD